MVILRKFQMLATLPFVQTIPYDFKILIICKVFLSHLKSPNMNNPQLCGQHHHQAVGSYDANIHCQHGRASVLLQSHFGKKKP